MLRDQLASHGVHPRTLLPTLGGSLSPKSSPHARPRHRKPSLFMGTSISQCSLANRLCGRGGLESRRDTSKGPLHERPSWEQTPGNSHFLTHLIKLFPAHPNRHANRIHICTQTDSHTGGAQICTHRSAQRWRADTQAPRHTQQTCPHGCRLMAVLTHVQVGPEFIPVPLNQKHLPLAESVNCASC